MSDDASVSSSAFSLNWVELQRRSIEVNQAALAAGGGGGGGDRGDAASSSTATLIDGTELTPQQLGNKIYHSKVHQIKN